MEVDWGDGDYARTAAELMPAAEVLVDAVGPGPGSTLLDVGCGTGNVALAAAARGAAATGVDPSAGLIALARERAAREGADARFLVGDAAAPPVPAGTFDAVASNFGVIFAPDAEAALAGMVGAARPGGIVALTSWLPGGAIYMAGRVLRKAFPAVQGPEARWDDPGWLRDRLAEAGAAAVEVRTAEIAIISASPEARLAEFEAHHPAWRAARRALAREAWPEVLARSLAALEDGNEDPGGFRTTSRYLVVTARRR